MEPAKKEMSSRSAHPSQRKRKGKPAPKKPSPKTPSPPEIPKEKEAEAINPGSTVDGGASGDEESSSDAEGPETGNSYIVRLPGMPPIFGAADNAEDFSRCAMQLVEHILRTRGAEIPPAFVLPLERRPGEVDSSVDIPLIDLKNWSWSGSDREVIVKQIGEAAQEWGSFQVVNHGVPKRLLSEVESSAKKFFDLELEEKRKVVRTADNAMGYFDMELTKNVRDWKEVYDYLVGERLENKWPPCPSEFRDACKTYSAAVEALAVKILELIVESLGVPATTLNKHFIGTSSTRSRLNYYRKCPSPDIVLGVSHHKDPGALTILAQDDVGGLQVRSQKDGRWIQVKPRRDAFAVNIGDLLQVWSNGKYPSIEHRVVVNTTKDRFSSPLFFCPAYITDVAPLPSLVNESNPAKYRPVNWGDYYTMRRDGNFRNLGKPNVQIDNWAIRITPME